MTEISSDVIRGYNDTMILYILLKEPSYGYEISRQIRVLTEEKYIDAVWCEGEFTWTYNTNIPHATFDIFDDEEKYCKGIVFELKDMFNELDYQ